MSSTFKEGYDKYLEDRKVNLGEIVDLQKKYLEGTDEQITQEGNTSKIDAQMLEDAKNQSWLKVDLIRANESKCRRIYCCFKKQYDLSLKSGNTELAGKYLKNIIVCLQNKCKSKNKFNLPLKIDTIWNLPQLMDKKLPKEKQIQGFC